MGHERSSPQQSTGIAAELATLRLALEHAGTCVLFTDDSARITWASPRLESLAGFTPDEVLNKTPEFLHEPEDWVAVLAALPGAPLRRAELRARTKSGDALWVGLDVRRRAAAAGLGSGLLWVYTDVSEHVACSRRLADTLHEAERARNLFEAASAIANLGHWEVSIPSGDLAWSATTYAIHDLPPGRPITVEEAIGYYAPHFRDMVSLALKRSVRSGDPFEFEAELITAAKRRVWINCRGVAVRSSDGTITGLRGVIQDISRRRDAERALRDNEQRLRVLIDAIPSFVVLKDGEGRWQLLNEVSVERLRLRGVSWKGWTERDLARYRPDLCEAAERWMRSDEYAWRHGKRVTEDFTLEIDGDQRFLEVTRIPIFTDEGQRRALVVVSTDITERKRQTDLIERERALFASGPVSVIVWDPAPGLPVTYASANVREVLGFSPTRMTTPGFLYTSIIHPDDLPGYLDAVRERQEQRAPGYELAYRILGEQGRELWVYDCTHIEYGADGRIASLRGYLFDQTQLKSTMEALRERDAKLATISVHVPGMLYEYAPALGEAGAYPFASEGIHGLFGLAPEDVRHDASALRALLAPEDLAAHDASLRAAAEEDMDWSLEYRIRHPERGERWIHASASPRRSEDGSVVWNGYCFDVTERKLAEERQIREGKREAIERLAGGIAHDFNNYLSSISLSAELLHARTDIPADAQRMLAGLVKEIRSAGTVARQLLAFTKDQPLHLESLVLDPFLRDCAAFALRGSAMRSVVDVPDRETSVTADPNLLRQVLFNLLINARQALRDHGTAFLTAEDIGGGRVIIKVADTGPGIPPEHRDKIFEPYFTTKSTGSGLGLHVVRSLLNRMGGDIALDTTAPGGATFLLALPAAALPPARVQETHPPFLATQPQGVGHTHFVLLEDEERQVEILRSYIAKIGLTMETYGDGADLLRHCAPLRPVGGRVFCMLDITVRGGLGGLDILRDLRAALPEATLVLCSGYTDDWTRHGDQLGGLNVQFLPKPYQLKQLRRLLEG